MDTTSPSESLLQEARVAYRRRTASPVPASDAGAVQDSGTIIDDGMRFERRPESPGLGGLGQHHSMNSAPQDQDGDESTTLGDVVELGSAAAVDTPSPAYALMGSYNGSRSSASNDVPARDCAMLPTVTAETPSNLREPYGPIHLNKTREGRKTKRKRTSSDGGSCPDNKRSFVNNEDSEPWSWLRAGQPHDLSIVQRIDEVGLLTSPPSALERTKLPTSSTVSGPALPGRPAGSGPTSAKTAEPDATGSRSSPEAVGMTNDGQYMDMENDMWGT